MQTFKIYTKTGDKGETSLFGGKRVKKSSARVNAYGTIDELNSYIGLCAAYVNKNKKLLKATKENNIDLVTKLYSIQAKLLCVGSMCATEIQGPVKVGDKVIEVTEEDITSLEESIDAMDSYLPAITYFILPTGSVAASHVHVVRTITRRAERLLVVLSDKEEINPAIIKYINRLSDYFYTLARYINFLEGEKDIKWEY